MQSPTTAISTRRLLVERIASSRHIAKSARLRALLMYLCERVIEDGAEEIHELEVGHAVFGRAKNYDTALDNIVRVHASTLRKRLEQFFAEEGSNEPVVIDLPKGNYAPVFRERTIFQEPVEQVAQVTPTQNWIVPLLAIAAAAFACSTLVLGWRLQSLPSSSPSSLPQPVRIFWSAVFRPGEKTDIVLDDAALGLYQELEDRPIGLSEYFDRGYLKRLGERVANDPLVPRVAESILLKRHSGYAGANLLWPLSHTASALQSDGLIHFARDYSFRELKANRAILLGNARSNPWIEPFESRLGLRWEYDRTSGVYYPVDAWAAPADHGRYRLEGDHPDGYCSIALLSNLGGTGAVLIISATGGSAASTAAAFLLDPERMSWLRARLPVTKDGMFPHFEALLKIPNRSKLAKSAELVVCRTTRD